MTHHLYPTEYIYRDHWVTLHGDLWRVTDERGESAVALHESQSIDDCMEAIDNVMDDLAAGLEIGDAINKVLG